MVDLLVGGVLSKDFWPLVFPELLLANWWVWLISDTTVCRVKCPKAGVVLLEGGASSWGGLLKDNGVLDLALACWQVGWVMTK